MPGIFSFASSRLGLCRTSHLLPGSPPVSRWSPAKTHPSFTVEDRSSPARRFEEFGSTWCISLEAAHPAGEHVFCSPSRWRTCVLQPTPRRTVGSRAHLLRERRIRGPTHSETTCSLASPSLHESLQGLRTYPHLWCMRVFLRGAGAYFQDVYVRTYVSIYVRRYVRT